LLVVILIFAGWATRLATVVALIASISCFLGRLYPIIRSLDREGHITPRGYSRTLAVMILAFIVVFIVALVWSLVGG